MRTYSIAIANDYVAVNSPLIINAGYYNEKLSGYKCITKLSSMESVEHYRIVPYTQGIVNINDTTLIVKDPGSYTVFLHDDSQTDNGPVPFNFYAWQDVFEMNIDTINFILSQELPSLYKSTNVLNDADNEGMAAVILQTYGVLYVLFYNAITSIGTGQSYNENWEFVYVGINKILQNAAHPAQFIKTLMRVKSQTSTRIYSLSITISRLLFQLINIPVPVEIVYSDALGGYDINIYNEIIDTWSLGVSGRSELGVTTFLLGQGSSFIWLISVVIARIMPAFVKWKINYFSIADFNSNFNVSDVDDADFYDPDILYDAYMIINNNNNFNTKGFLHD